MLHDEHKRKLQRQKPASSLITGLQMLAFGSMISWAFGVHELVVDVFRTDAPSTAARVEVLAIEGTSLNINQYRVMAHQLRATAGDRLVAGVGFSTGDGYEVGSVLDGRVTASGVVVVEGLRTTQLPKAGLLLLLIPVGGLAVVLFSLGRQLRARP